MRKKGKLYPDIYVQTNAPSSSSLSSFFFPPEHEFICIYSGCLLFWQSVQSQSSLYPASFSQPDALWQTERALWMTDWIPLRLLHSLRLCLSISAVYLQRRKKKEKKKTTKQTTERFEQKAAWQIHNCKSKWILTKSVIVNSAWLCCTSN